MSQSDIWWLVHNSFILVLHLRVTCLNTRFKSEITPMLKLKCLSCFWCNKLSSLNCFSEGTCNGSCIKHILTHGFPGGLVVEDLVMSHRSNTWPGTLAQPRPRAPSSAEVSSAYSFAIRNSGRNSFSEALSKPRKPNPSHLPSENPLPTENTLYEHRQNRFPGNQKAERICCQWARSPRRITWSFPGRRGRGVSDGPAVGRRQPRPVGSVNRETQKTFTSLWKTQPYKANITTWNCGLVTNVRSEIKGKR